MDKFPMPIGVLIPTSDFGLKICFKSALFDRLTTLLHQPLVIRQIVMTQQNWA